MMQRLFKNHGRFIKLTVFQIEELIQSLAEAHETEKMCALFTELRMVTKECQKHLLDLADFRGSFEKIWLNIWMLCLAYLAHHVLYWFINSMEA